MLLLKSAVLQSFGHQTIQSHRSASHLSFWKLKLQDPRLILQWLTLPATQQTMIAFSVFADQGTWTPAPDAAKQGGGYGAWIAMLGQPIAVLGQSNYAFVGTAVWNGVIVLSAEVRISSSVRSTLKSKGELQGLQSEWNPWKLQSTGSWKPWRYQNRCHSRWEFTHSLSSTWFILGFIAKWVPQSGCDWKGLKILRVSLVESISKSFENQIAAWVQGLRVTRLVTGLFTWLFVMSRT